MGSKEQCKVEHEDWTATAQINALSASECHGKVSHLELDDGERGASAIGIKVPDSTIHHKLDITKSVRELNSFCLIS